MWMEERTLGVDSGFHSEVYTVSIVRMFPEQNSTIALFSALFQVPVVVIDSYYYGKLVIAPLNIVLYNVFTPHGPDLYGTDFWYFYLINEFLNFIVVFTH